LARLVVAADFKVLHGERKALWGREKYQKADWLFLRWEQEGEQRNGYIYLIVRVCETRLDIFSFLLLDPFTLYYILI
jgi:hypothetical protein